MTIIEAIILGIVQGLTEVHSYLQFGSSYYYPLVV